MHIFTPASFDRAFYGWLAHCRHLRTVRKHLGGLAFHEPIIVMEETTWSEGVNFTNILQAAFLIKSVL
jgi:hypothetical protein